MCLRGYWVEVCGEEASDLEVVLGRGCQCVARRNRAEASRGMLPISREGSFPVTCRMRFAQTSQLCIFTQCPT